jgi:hypothetical protein
VKQDPEYRKELIIEATNAFPDGDISTGKTLLRDYYPIQLKTCHNSPPL